MPVFRLSDYMDENEDRGKVEKINKKKVRKMMRYDCKDDFSGSGIKIGQRNKGAGSLVSSKPKGPKGKSLPNPGDKKGITNEGDFDMSFVSQYLSDAIGGDADALAAADKAVVSKGRKKAHGKGNVTRSYIGDKTGESIEPNPQEKVKSKNPDLGRGSSKKGGDAKKVRGGR